jgi:hypothetical protein
MVVVAQANQKIHLLTHERKFNVFPDGISFSSKHKKNKLHL